MSEFEFDKEEFKKNVVNAVKSRYRKTIDEADKQQVFQAVAYTVKDYIIDRWIATHKEFEKQDAKTVYYMSMEFLMGRALGNNMINLTCYKGVKEALDELGFDLNAIEDEEPDDLQHAFLIRYHLSDTLLTAVESDTDTECLHRKLKTVIRKKFLMTGFVTAIHLKSRDLNMRLP